MTETSEYDQALARAHRALNGSPRDASLLSDVACCAELPGRDRLGPPLEDRLPPGHALDCRFVLRKAIGRSGMATISRAGDRVAVKVPLMRVERNPVSFGRFQREARIGPALDDPLLLRFIKPPEPRLLAKCPLLGRLGDGPVLHP
jgi:hypothetical protein